MSSTRAVGVDGSDGPMDFTDHVANINAEAPVRAENTTWGRLMALFNRVEAQMWRCTRLKEGE